MNAPGAVDQPYDAVVLGGGFYGCALAVYLAGQRRLPRVLLLEAGTALLQRASRNNQARVHNGYHYPRSFVTANRSRLNFPLFVRDWAPAVRSDFTKVYAIARRNSKVTARQFQRFCREIGASLEPADIAVRQLFDRKLIEEVFIAQEYAFDAGALAQRATTELAAAGVEVRLGARGSDVRRNDGGLLLTSTTAATASVLRARLVFNCTYSGLNHVDEERIASAPLKHEITEMALMKAPESLGRIGVTVMDGPFFSFMPYPARGLHTLSHVRYTPHQSWLDAPGVDPYQRLASYPRESRSDRMIRDVARYMPAILDARYVDSLFEVKTVLVKNEVDDGRPILFERHEGLPGCYSILGGKIDNIYDVLQRLESEPLEAAAAPTAPSTDTMRLSL